uniref:Carboxypeptidase n=1 Tax=Rhizophora mucronata TaxID=61149 RepID=A0A2P2IJI9_RHIMU
MIANQGFIAEKALTKLVTYEIIFPSIYKHLDPSFKQSWNFYFIVLHPVRLLYCMKSNQCFLRLRLNWVSLPQFK